MGISYTKHAQKKFVDLAVFGIKITKSRIRAVVDKPKYQLVDNGNKIAVGAFDNKHNLRVIFKKEKGDIIIITFYIYRKGRYGEY